jgi:hypothetical protein
MKNEMDRFRRRPPMEGFSRPGSLGGEAYDEDSVEGHIMDDDRTQDIDTEGHGFLKASDEDDTEGHGNIARRADEDDTEGHAGIVRRADEDDTEGHAGWLKATDDDDTEGHSFRRAAEDDDTEGHGSKIK